MPKENINDIATTELRAEVLWKADPDGQGTGYVQVSTVHTDSPAVTHSGGDTTLPSGSYSITAGGEQSLSMPAHPTRDWEKLDGWHVTLDREQCNRMIRMLRRARDAAFGTDA